MIQAQEIRAARTKRGLTQIEAAIQVGVSYPAYRLWEMGGTRPTPDNETKLRAVLHLEDRDKKEHKEDEPCQQLRRAE